MVANPVQASEATSDFFSFQPTPAPSHGKPVNGVCLFFAEMEAYFADPTHATDPLLWWREQCAKFPNVARLAARYLIVPASEAPSERIISLGNGTVTDNRARLNPHTVRELVFVGRNQPILRWLDSLRAAADPIDGAENDSVDDFEPMPIDARNIVNLLP